MKSMKTITTTVYDSDQSMNICNTLNMDYTHACVKKKAVIKTVLQDLWSLKTLP